MELTRDILLKGTDWAKVIEAYEGIFKTRTRYELFMLALSIGVMYDQRISDPVSNEGDPEPGNVPRNVLQNNDNGKLDYIFQAAILTTSTETLTEDERLELAFGEKESFDKRDFLLEFANFGATKLLEQVGTTQLETMDNLKNFAAATVEGNNLEIEGLSDEILLLDDEDLF